MTRGGTDSPGTSRTSGGRAPWAARCRRWLQAPLPGQDRTGSASHAAGQEERGEPRGALAGAVPTGAHRPRAPRSLPRAPQHPPLGAALGSLRAPGEARPAQRWCSAGRAPRCFLTRMAPEKPKREEKPRASRVLKRKPPTSHSRRRRRCAFCGTWWLLGTAGCRGQGHAAGPAARPHGTATAALPGSACCAGAGDPDASRSAASQRRMHTHTRKSHFLFFLCCFCFWPQAFHNLTLQISYFS